MRGLTLAAVLLLAGCAHVAPHETPGALEAGSVHAFLHPGGELRLMGGEGRFIAADGSRLDGNGTAPAGTTYLFVADGDVRLLAGGDAVSTREVGWHVERHLLLAAEDGLPFLPDEERRATLDVQLERMPFFVRVLVAGSMAEAAIELHGDGLAIHAQGGIFDPLPFGDRGFIDMPHEEHGANFTTRLTGEALYRGDGTIVLEAWSYAEPPTATRAEAMLTLPAARYSYGTLPGAPVAFPVGRDAERLTFWSEEGGTVALFADHHLATVELAPGTKHDVRVAGPTEHVAVLLNGTVSMGVDAPPADLRLRLLEVRTAQHPTMAAGEGGGYGVRTARLELQDLFAVQDDTRGALGGGLLTPCQDEVVVLKADGETVGATGDLHLQVPVGAVPGAELSLWWDGFGEDGCPRPAFTFFSFVR